MNHTKSFHRAIWISALTLALANASPNARGDAVTFNSLIPGSVPSSVQAVSGLGPIVVKGLNPNFGANVNAAVIFDSSNPTGGDFDLGTTNQAFGGPGIGAGGGIGSPFVNGRRWGNILIVGDNLTDANNNNLIDVPNDFEGAGGKLTLDFSQIGPIFAIELAVIDTQGTGGTVKLYGAADVLLDTIAIPNTGDNGIKTLNLNHTHGVLKIVADLKGSGGVDNLCFDAEAEANEGCSHGYWKNHAAAWSGTGYTPVDDFDTVFNVDAFTPNITLMQALNLGGGGLNNLARQGVAALLNASTGNLAFPLTQAQVLTLVHDAILNGTAGTLATQLDSLNNYICPLN